MILFLSFFILSIIIFLLLNIKLSIVKFKISNINSVGHFKIVLIIKLGLYKDKKIKIFEVCMNKEKLLKNKYILNIKKKNEIKKDIEIINNDDIKNAIKKVKLNIERFNLKLNIGTEDAKLTAILFGVISTIWGVLVPLIYYSKNIKSLDEFEYELTPNFSNKNIFKLEFTGQLSIRLLHIIYILYISFKANKKSERYRICT